ncbi:MAG: GMC family oxidoreductase N-terminal domain-containing protein [Myxococcota bacterium]
MTDAFDTVVVGAGSAGAVIAARATEDGARRVCLLDAGPDYGAGPLPEELRDGTRNALRDHDWGLWHRPAASAARMRFPRGRVVGGSSAVNTCIALRGQPEDYDEWGLAEWRWEHCLPAFRRLERDLDFPDAPHHGAGGPLPLRRHPPGELTCWQAAFLEACVELGFPACPDSNAPGALGAGPHAMNKTPEGRRISAAEVYLDAAVGRRPGFTLRPDTRGRRLRFEGRRVVGVEVEDRRGVRVIRARRVVLSAGAIGTPGVLLRSGVGPAKELLRLGVDRVANVPAVGRQLRDHPGVAVCFVPKAGVSAVSDPIIQTVLRWRSRAGGFPADLQLQAGSFFPLPGCPVPLTTLMFQVGKPRSVGRLYVADADPHTKPRIESRFFTDADDVRVADEALELLWLLGSARPLRELADFAVPGEGALSRRSSARQLLRTQVGSGYHPCGTVPMGDAARIARGEAACDAQGRVHGTEGLVVADASLFPTIPSANTNLPTLMLGERVGAWLRDGAYD